MYGTQMTSTSVTLYSWRNLQTEFRTFARRDAVNVYQAKYYKHTRTGCV